VSNAPSWADDLDLLKDAAVPASKIAMEYFNDPSRNGVRLKNGHSPVSDGDLAVNAYLRTTLLGARQDYGWLSEETADTNPQERMTSPRTFVVDPIDGTRAYIAGKQTWCISMAVIEKGKPVAGVLACPAMGETFAATADSAPTLNDIVLPKASDVCHSVRIAGDHKKTERLMADGPAGLERHEHIPSLAYRMAMVADGRLAGTFIRSGANDWDIAAAMLLIEKTAHILADTGGNAIKINAAGVRKPAMIACHPALEGIMLGVAAS